MAPVLSRICFHDAESEADEVLQRVWKRFDKIVWDKRIKARSWGFAAECAINVMLSQVDLCFIYVEKPELMEGPKWDLQPELEPGPIDFWARRALPTMKKKDIGAYKATTATARRSVVSKKAATTEEQLRGKASAHDPLAQVSEEGRRTQLDEKYMHDEEEIRYREAKLLEDKRNRDEETRAKERKREEERERDTAGATEVAMSKKRYTFDTEGNILWVELPNLSKLPKVSVELPFRCGEESEKGGTAVSPSGRRPKAQPKKKSFEDGFTKLPLEQPHIADVIELKPGVNLQTAGKLKAGPAREDKTMSLSAYQKYVEQMDKS